MATATTNAYAPNAERAKFRERVSEMMRKRKDPNYVKFALEQVGYDTSVIDEELGRIQSVQTGQPVKKNANAIPGESIDQMNLTGQQQTALLYGQRLYTSGKLLDNFDEGIAKKDFLGSVKQKAQEAAVGGTITNQFVDPEFQQYDQAKRDFINATLRRESGAVISDAEFDNANKQYFPRPGDDEKTIAQKKANRELIAKGFLKSAGVQDSEINFQDQQTQQGKVSLNSPEEAAKWLQDNPNDPGADIVRKKLESVGYDSSKQSAQAPVSDQGANTDFTALGGAIGEKVGSFTGGNKIGAAIGNEIGGVMSKYGDAGRSFQDTLTKFAELKANGTIDESQYNKLVDNLEETAKSAFDYNGPSFREVAGDVVKAGVNVLGGAEVKGATFLGSVARAALWGGAYGAADAQSGGKGLGDTLKESATTAALSAIIPVAGAGISKTWKSVVGKNTPEEALGEILQGKTKDLTAGQRVFKVLDTKGVETYDQLGTKVDDFISASAQKVDELMGQDETVRNLSELATSGKTTSGKTVKTNYVEKAMEQLQELYTKVGDNVSAANVGELLAKAKTNGLTNLEVNQLARKYGIEFGDKAFNKIGDPLTSVNAQMFETVRKGLKDVARSGLNGTEAKNLDSLISDSITVRTLVRKNIEKINALEQRVSKRGWGEKIGRGLGIATDTLTGGVLTGFVKKLIPSNVGLKTLNSLDLESHLAKNLKILEEAAGAETSGAVTRILKRLNRGIIEKAKNIKPGMSIQDVSPRGTEARKKLAELSRKASEAKTEAVRNRYKKAMQNLIDTENKA